MLINHLPNTLGEGAVLSCVLALSKGLPGGSSGKGPASNRGDRGDVGSIPGSRRSPGVGHGNPPQYSYLENPEVRGAWPAIVHSL